MHDLKSNSDYCWNHACFLGYLLVGGLWGIFYFHEVQGAAIITKWLVSAIVAVSGILLLSYEHHAA